MKSSLKNISFLSLGSVFLLAVAGIISGLGGKIVYYLAFILPVLAYALYFKKDKVKPLKFYTGRGQIALFTPLVFPAISLIILTSALTSLVLLLFGKENGASLDTGLFVAILDKALLPAVLEEALYRYVIISMLLPFSKKGAVLYSALFFALAHCDLFQIPYAFVAGLIFAAIDVAFDSVLPSLILHFLNNSVSVLWIFYFSQHELAFIIPLALLSVISIIFIVIFREKYKQLLSSLKGGELAYSLAVTVFIGVTLFVAVSALL